MLPRPFVLLSVPLFLGSISYCGGQDEEPQAFMVLAEHTPDRQRFGPTQIHGLSQQLSDLCGLTKNQR